METDAENTMGNKSQKNKGWEMHRFLVASPPKKLTAFKSPLTLDTKDKQLQTTTAKMTETAHDQITSQMANKALYLDNLTLTRLPEIPSHMEEIYLKKCHFTEWSELPAGLRLLSLMECKFHEQPSLPASLQHLSVTLGDAPTAIPQSLISLNLKECNMTSLPTDLPNLTYMWLDTSSISYIPDYPALEELYLVNCTGSITVDTSPSQTFFVGNIGKSTDRLTELRLVKQISPRAQMQVYKLGAKSNGESELEYGCAVDTLNDMFGTTKTTYAHKAFNITELFRTPKLKHFQAIKPSSYGDDTYMFDLTMLELPTVWKSAAAAVAVGGV
jgi:hypothetical protein